MTATEIYKTRELHSTTRLQQLRRGLEKLPETGNFPELTIFGAGSYARHEASEFSDIDLFFITNAKKEDVSDLRTKSYRLFGKIIDIAEEMDFPKFSNDCEYLTIIHTHDILKNLGSRTDDHENYFTARMLLLLESECLYGREVFDEVVRSIINSYFVDYPDHEQTFEPTFLINDICRFWKTLLLNYENKKNLPAGSPEETEQRKIKQKVRNFKLKYSRMSTCFASIAALGSHDAPVTIEQVIEMTRLTPRARLESVVTHIPGVSAAVMDVLERYSWFLEKTGLPQTELEAHFADKQQRTHMFERANEYGDAMFSLLQAIDAQGQRQRLLRTLVI
jgi:predicted nucleotidyltransferase